MQPELNSMQGVERILTDIALAINAKARNEGWQAPTLLNSWVNYSSGYDTVGYMKDSLGFVHIRGFIKSGTVTMGTTVFNLPAGYRPSMSTYISSVAAPGSVLAAFSIESSGDVKILTGSATYTSLGHIVFQAA